MKVPPRRHKSRVHLIITTTFSDSPPEDLRSDLISYRKRGHDYAEWEISDAQYCTRRIIHEMLLEPKLTREIHAQIAKAMLSSKYGAQIRDNPDLLWGILSETIKVTERLVSEDRNFRLLGENANTSILICDFLTKCIKTEVEFITPIEILS